MNTKNIFAFIFTALLFFVSTSKAQQPKDFWVYDSQVMIPWNYFCATGNIHISYSDYTSPQSGLEYVQLDGSSLNLGGNLHPTDVSFTVCEEGTFSVQSKLTYWNGSTYVYVYRTATVTVTKQPTPPMAPKISYFSQSPDPVYNGGTGTVYVYLSEGTGDITYSWYLSYSPSGMTASITPQGDHSQVTYYIPYNTKPAIYLTCVVSNYLGTDVKSYQLNVAALYPYTW